jgi:zinc D-Ala-D-Ala carboxypeptidase
VTKKARLIASGLSIFVLAAAAYAGWRFWMLNEGNTRLLVELAAKGGELARMRSEIEHLSAELEDERYRNENLTNSLTEERAKNQLFENQIRDISGAVGTLQKLSATDPELLAKYSKVYFLSENYAPKTLSAVDARHRSNPDKPVLVLANVTPYLQKMLEAAERDGSPLKVVSAYRSFAEQAEIKTGYKVLYGSGANQFSADQGYSEHQLGTTVDFTAAPLTGLSLEFERTDGYKWLEENAHKFGFILSYPRGNAYYQFEPWHWRFVGITLATKLHDENRRFYELTQREIDPYLVTLFD